MANGQAQQSGHTGVMVALYPPQDIAAGLALPDGEPQDELHVTLAYLGEAADLSDEVYTALQSALANFAAGAQPVSATISGIGLFNTAEDEDGVNAFYASVDSPDLVTFRPALIEALAPTGCEVANNHGFTAHMTLAYVKPDAPLPVTSVPNTPVTFDTISLVRGDERSNYPLGKKVTQTQKGYDAKAGQVIVGNLVRGSDGKFTSGGSEPAAGSAEDIAAIKGRLANLENSGGKGKGKGKGGGKGKAAAKPKLTPEQKEQQRLDNIANITPGLNLGTAGDAIMESDLNTTDIDNLNDKAKDDLTDKGITTKNSDGSVSLTPAGKQLIKSIEKGDAKKAANYARLAQKTADNKAATLSTRAADAAAQASDQQARAQKIADRSAQRAARIREKLSKIKTKEVSDLSLTTDAAGNSTVGFKLGDSKYKSVIDATSEPLSFTLKETAEGLRWFLFSSSGFKDRDRHNVTTKALQNDCDRADIDRNFGPLLWHHAKELELGTCDYNAVFNNILVESGTFHTPEIGQMVKSIAETTPLGASIGFNNLITEPGDSLEFNWIYRNERSLLRQEKASNLLTRLFLGKRTEKMATLKDKISELVTLAGGDAQALDTVGGLIGRTKELKDQARKAGLTLKAEGGDAAQSAGGAAEGDMSDPDEAAEETETVGDMTQADLEDLIGEVLDEKLAPVIEALGGASATKEVNQVAQVLGGVLDLIGSQTKEIAALRETVKGLVGDPAKPNGYRGSQDASNVISQVVKEQAPAPDSFDAFAAQLFPGLANK